jgi:hypothetical protein
MFSNHQRLIGLIKHFYFYVSLGQFHFNRFYRPRVARSVSLHQIIIVRVSLGQFHFNRLLSPACRSVSFTSPDYYRTRVARSVSLHQIIIARVSLGQFHFTRYFIARALKSVSHCQSGSMLQYNPAKPCYLMKHRRQFA